MNELKDKERKLSIGEREQQKLIRIEDELRIRELADILGIKKNPEYSMLSIGLENGDSYNLIEILHKVITHSGRNIKKKIKKMELFRTESR